MTSRSACISTSACGKSSDGGRKYREPKPEPDINVIAKASIRHVESKKQLENLQSAVKERKQLNPAIRSELIRALKARANAYLSLAAKLEKGAGR